MSPEKLLDFSENRRPNRFQPTGLLHFLPIYPRHIKHVGYLIEPGGNPGRMHRQPQLKNRVRDNVQQSLPIIRKNIQNGKAIGRFIVDPHFRRLPVCW